MSFSAVPSRICILRKASALLVGCGEAILCFAIFVPLATVYWPVLFHDVAACTREYDIRAAKWCDRVTGEVMARDSGRVTRACFALSLVLGVACLALMWVAPQVRASLFPTYRSVSKVVATALATVTSIVPFAVWDIGIVCLVLVGVACLVRRVRRKAPLAPVFAAACLLISCNAFLFVAWAFNHYAPALADELELEVGQYTTEELADATRFYLSQAAERAPLVPRKDDGELVKQDFFELARVTGASYEDLARSYPIFRGPTVPVKALLIWGEPLLYTGHTGMYWAPTAESGVPLNTAKADLPFIMCHEAAHRLGIASEQEANFVAFLACQASDDVRLSYSGYFNAFGYCLNALLRTDPERVQPLLQEVADAGLYEGVVYVLTDREATRAHYQAYEGPVEDVGTAVNDTYLKSFGESEGVRSYGLVVDYLIAWNGRG